MTELLGYPPFPAEDDAVLSLVCIRNDAGDVLMGRKTRGFGAGRLVLPGGKGRYWAGSSGILRSPFIYDAAREVHEETGIALDATALTQVGQLHVERHDSEMDVLQIFAGSSNDMPHDSEELEDVAFMAEVPYAEMPADYKLWLPHILGGRAVTAYVWLNSSTDVFVSR